MIHHPNGRIPEKVFDVQHRLFTGIIQKSNSIWKLIKYTKFSWHKKCRQY